MVQDKGASSYLGALYNTSLKAMEVERRLLEVFYLL